MLIIIQLSIYIFHLRCYFYFYANSCNSASGEFLAIRSSCEIQGNISVALLLMGELVDYAYFCSKFMN